MNLLFLIHDMSHGAGTERVLSTLANELAERGYSINIVSCQNGLSSTFELHENIHLDTLKGEQILNPILRKINNIKKLRDICKQTKFDVIICVDVTLCLYLPFINVNHSKVIAWEHFSYDVVFGSKLQKIARKFSASYCDALVVLTKADLKCYMDNEKFIKNIVQINNPINITQNIKYKEEKKTVLAVGRLENEKGFDLLLQSWKLVEDKYPEWRLKIVGEGSKRAELESLSTNLKLLKVSLSGYTSNIELEYENADIFVCSSRSEGFGMVLIEAQSYGIPVISFDCPVGPGEIIENGKNGILVENGETQKLAEAIKELIENTELRELLAKNAKYTVMQFNAKAVASEWENLFKTL